MKGKFGMIIVDGRGKLGGHVLTKNRQGAAARTKVTPINRRSNSQQNARSTFTNLSQDWRDLSQADRDAWNSAAGDFKKTNIFGDSYSPTGKNLYAIVNSNLLAAGQATVTVPPAAESPTAVTSFSVASNTTAAQTLAYVPTPVAADNTLIIEATRPLSAGVGAAGAQYRKIGTVAAAAASPFNSFAAYTAVFGTPVAGKKIFFRCTPINNNSGMKGIPMQASSVTV
jgi:hypothetical protein